MKQRQKRSMVFIDLLPLMIVLITTLAAVAVNSSYTDKISAYSVDLSDGWVSESGEILSVCDLPEGDITVSHDLADIDVTGGSICFRTAHAYITVLFDGTRAYEYAPKQAAILGKSYGRNIHTVYIPEGTNTVTFKLHPLYDDKAVVVENIAVEDAALYINNVYRRGLPNFATCMMIALFGLLMLVLGFSSHEDDDSETINFFSLGTFAILIGVWAANDTMVFQVYTNHPEIGRFINYTCLMFAPYPPVSFLASSTKQRGTKAVPVMGLLVMLNFTITMILSLLGIRDIREMLSFSHVNAAVAIVMAMYLMIRASKKKTVSAVYLQNIVAGMAFVVVGVAVDLVRYLLYPDSALGSSLFTRVSVFIFLVLMAVHLIRERTRSAVERGQAELMKKMAYTDGLTGLGNRTAFSEREKEIMRDKTECVVVQFDINYLKKVNDMFGHAEGDRHIISAANIISETFGDIGKCYRTGGDEFILLTQTGTVRDVEDALIKLEQRVSDHNTNEKPPLPLQIAYGYARCSKQTDSLEEAERLADKRMYEKKSKMKLPI